MPRDKRRGQAWAHAARSEGESADKVPRPAAAEGDRARAAGGTKQDKKPGKGTGTRRAPRGASRTPRRAATERMEWGEARSVSVGASKGMESSTGGMRAPAGQARAQVTGGRTRSAERGTKAQGRGRDPKGKGKGASGTDWTGHGSRGGEGRGTGGGAPPQPDVQPVRCIPPGIQQMPAHHTQRHHHHHTHLYNIDPDAGDLIPPPPPRPQHQHAPPAPRAGPARMAAASAGGGRDAALAPQAQGPQGGPARGAE